MGPLGVFGGRVFTSDAGFEPETIDAEVRCPDLSTNRDLLNGTDSNGWPLSLGRGKAQRTNANTSCPEMLHPVRRHSQGGGGDQKTPVPSGTEGTTETTKRDGGHA